MLGRCLAAGAGASFGAEVLYRNRLPREQKPGQSRVAILPVDSYSERLVAVLMESLKVFGLKIHGKSVLL